MKSIKPGRGPSMMGGVMGIAAALFGVFWIIMAVSMGAWFMAPFGLIFIGVSVFKAVYNFKNATGKNRYSEYDITDENEEIDPWNEKFGEKREINPEINPQTFADSRFCPYCGAKAAPDFEFCNVCGKKIP